uniref:probable terpene synthase 11 isoform X2 n=1 Tax=Erigeron canadensis TaxID=72917 RepID=UPI001CB9A904|nr:probable terpene synthase 11 isoform X2 [Erigeron canadensis]
MTSRYYITCKFNVPSHVSCKVSYPWQLVNISHFKSFKICTMCVSSSKLLGANKTNTTKTNIDILSDFMSPILATNTMGMIQDNNFLKLDQHHELKVIQPHVDVNKINELKEITRRLLTMTSDPTLMTMKLIDTIQRLGLGYYFKEEIDEILKSVSHLLLDDDGLYATALCFRLQRHNGLHTNPNVFKKFMDANGKVKKSLSEDIEGLLSLYEASYLSTNEEYLLLHLKDFATRHLEESLLSQFSPKLKKKVVDSLKLPRHMRMERLEARKYIEEYVNEDDHNPILLEFAKLDYNRVQLIFRKELVEITSWWKELGLASKLSFVRDRHVECFVWTVGLLPEPKDTSCRIVLAKAIAIMLVIDDIYDTYGAYGDLVLFTRAIQRWDLKEAEQLPEYMKVCYMALYNTNNEICDQVLKKHGLCVQPFLTKTWIDLVEAYMVEVEWVRQGIVPNLKDYMDNGIVSSGTYMAMVHLFVLILEGVTNENIRHLLDPYPKFFTLAGTILRLWDDLGTSKEEEERGDALSSIQLLMKDKHIACEEEGRNQILQIINGLWKDLNSELVKSNLELFPMIQVAFNTSRASQVVYQHNEDSYLSSVKSQVQNLFFKPIDF